MGELRVHLFGRFCVEWNGEALAGFEARRVQELFSYLLLERKRPHAREVLATLLWAEQATSRSKKYLRQALWQLQTALDVTDANGDAPILLAETEWIQVNPDASLWLDVSQFEKAFHAVQGVAGRTLTKEQLHLLEQVVDVYRGDLLEGWYKDWCLFQRERLQNLYLAMLDKLMGYCEFHQRYERGVVYGSRILAFDRARERTHRRLMRLHYLQGNRTSALRQYDRCCLALSEELGVEPARSTNRLYEQIRADRFNDESLSMLAMLPGERDPAKAKIPLSSTLGRLKQLHNLILDVQERLYQEIQTVEEAARKQS